MKENNESWDIQLNTVIIEIAGLSEIFKSIPAFLQILAKLEGLRYEEENISFSIFRKTIFEVLSLMGELKAYAR